MRKGTRTLIVPLLLLLALSLVLSSCARVHRGKTVETAGFLGDYSQLKEGEGDQPLLFYRNPETHFANYDKIILDPIEIWQVEGSEKLKRKDVRILTTALYQAIEEQLGQDCEMVKKPGEGVMRLRVAITGARKTTVVFDTITTYLPQGLIISWGKRLTTGSHAFTGKAAIEAELLDSVTKERLVAGVDERKGEKVPKADFTSWNDAKAAFDLWGKKFRARLAKLKQEQR